MKETKRIQRKVNTGDRSAAMPKHARNGLGRLLGPIAVFFRGFIESPRMVGSVIPSSRVTIDAMLQRVDWKNCKIFVEYGP
ncbi:MAG: hypothetical protein RIC51_02565, partial [Erythrobacter sp.]